MIIRHHEYSMKFPRISSPTIFFFVLVFKKVSQYERVKVFYIDSCFRNSIIAKHYYFLINEYFVFHSDEKKRAFDFVKKIIPILSKQVKSSILLPFVFTLMSFSIPILIDTPCYYNLQYVYKTLRIDRY